ncbi:autotransporter domain-containing protein [Flagellimonas meridianipacifica]|uniref:Outer membrane protein with beta-barrel domain n=1 Tax=Flagellimonas meridianipacifica TaxID=1080225 RepID=A0A2T0MG03_9FLAO|nr:autotransporter domain-containing protein [Allomuricauda pacifica]PRX56511.1 outer membrane protein with beta-barrel domain [Allomuricauda pacifica]
MKKRFFLAVVLSTCLIYAQEQKKDKLTIEKGTWTLGGNVSFRTDTFDSSINNTITDGNGEIIDVFSEELNRDFSSVSLFPRVGYVFSDNWVVGLLADYSVNNSDTERIQEGQDASFSEFKSEGISLAPYVRRYFGVTPDLAFYMQGEVGYGKSWSEEIFENSERRTSSGDNFFVNLRPGVSFFATKNLALESSIGVLGYSSFNSENENSENEGQNFNFSINGSDLLFGLSYFF